MVLKDSDQQYVVTEFPLEGSAERLGGKAFHLFDLQRHGFEVPPFFVVNTDAFCHHCERNDEIGKAIQQLGSVADVPGEQSVADLQRAFNDIEIEADLIGEIESALTRLGGQEQLYAVRSSASDEDGADHSFAGMHDSFLCVRGLDDIIRRMKQVWASAFNQRAIAYRLENQLDVCQTAVAVVVQRLIDARASGVVFTINPANHRADETVISSLWGAGEGLVSAGLAADTFVVNKQSFEIESEVAEKTESLVNDPNNGGLKSEPVESARQSSPSLSPAELQQLAERALEIEKCYRRPQDIEFSVDASGELFILQTRPITNVKEYGPAAGNRLVWDNSNIIESYSGVTSPMTFSFIRRAYTIVYHCFAEVMGISKKKVHAQRHVFENMLGLIRGRVYYNLQNWYRLIRLFPGFQYNAQFMESMMGLQEPLILDDQVDSPGLFRRWFFELPALLKLVARTSWNFLRIKPIVNEFQNSFHEHYRRWDAMDFHELAPHEMKALYDEMEDALLWNWKAPIINDFYVMIYYGLLRRLCGKWIGDETGALQNDLICGEGGIESAEPAKMLLRLAAIAEKNAKLREAIQTDPLEAVPDRVSGDPDFVEFNTMMKEYLNRYGFRCMNELKLEEYSLRDRPHVVYQVLRNYLALDDQAALDVDAMHQREQNIRQQAEQTARAGLRKKWSWLPRKLIFNRVLRNARLGVKNRENMRFARTRIYGILRELLRAMGTRLARERILDDREDIFYLTLDEVWDFIKGTAVSTNLRELAQVRRREFDDYREQASPDERFDTYGFVYHKNLFQNVSREEISLEDGQLRGTGCCPGSVTKSVRVLRTPSDNLSLSGEILVAERTDPGWVPLYPAVSGVLIERGSILSHSAVVAREMGIPTIVGIKGLLQHVQDGDTVTMDGGSGIVELVESVKTESSESNE